MFKLKNGLYLDTYFDADVGELDGEAVWSVDEIADEFWDHENNPQFMFNCGPRTVEELISENFCISNALDAELPHYIWPESKLNRYIFYRLDAEKELRKTLTFKEAVAIVAGHMKRLGIEREES